MTKEQQKTLNGLREAGAFGLEWSTANKHWWLPVKHYDLEANEHYYIHDKYIDEAAYGLMVMRGLDELKNRRGKDEDWMDILLYLCGFDAGGSHYPDMLAASIAVLEGEG